MALREWPPARIRRFRIGGALVELALILIPLAYSAFISPDWQRRATPLDSLGPISSTPLTPTQLDSLARRAKANLDSMGARLDTNGDTTTLYLDDSIALSIIKRGDTVQAVHLSPAARREAGRVLGSMAIAFGKASDALFRQLLLLLALVYLPILLLLGTLTTVWAVQRRKVNGPSDR